MVKYIRIVRTFPQQYFNLSEVNDQNKHMVLLRGPEFVSTSSFYGVIFRPTRQLLWPFLLIEYFSTYITWLSN